MNIPSVYDDIIEVAENDSEAAFKRLHRHFLPGLLSYTGSLLGSTELAEEAVSDVFIKVWLNRKTLPTINNLSYYLYTAAKHTALDYLRRRRKAALVGLEEIGEKINVESPEDRSIQQEHLRQIETAINTLPVKCRLIFRLIKEEGLKYKEVAQLLSLSPKTVEAHMTLAYSRIAECLENLMPEFSVVRKASGM